MAAEGFVGGFATPRPGAPAPPPKDDRYQHGWPTPSLTPASSIGPSWTQSEHEDPSVPEQYVYATHQLAHMTAIERSQNLRVATMNPVLQFMAGPLLRYDTVDADGVWHGDGGLLRQNDSDFSSCSLCRRSVQRHRSPHAISAANTSLLSLRHHAAKNVLRSHDERPS